MAIVHTQGDQPQRLFYYLHVNEECNLQCTFCYYKDPGKMHTTLQYKPSDLLKAVMESPIPHHIITFYGKEPLMSLDFIRECFRSFPETAEQQAGKKIDFGIITNGMLLNELSPAELNRFCLIIVSFNGLVQYHDPDRGEGVFEQVLNNILKIRPVFKGTLEGRLVINEKIDLNIAVATMLNLFDTIHWSLVEDGNVESYNLFIDRYCEQLDRLYQLWLAELRSGKVHNIIPFVGAVKNRLKEEYFTRLQCGAGYNSVGVGLDGSYYKCIDCVGRRQITAEHLSGSIWENFNPGRGIDTRPECRECDLFRLCGGRCMWTPSLTYCRSTRYMLNLVEKSIAEVESLLKQNVFSLNDFNDLVIEYEEVIP